MGVKDLSGNGTTSDNNGNNSKGGGVSIVSGGNAYPPGYNGNGFDPSDILINYNQKFAGGAEAMFREDVIKQTFAALISKNKPNAILMGPAGSGKTRIVEDMAYRLSQKNNPTVPDKIQGYTIYELPLNNLTAGTALAGSLEEKIAGIIEFAEDPKNKCILFIDEIHVFTSQKVSMIYKQIAQAFKPALARGDMRVIGATTTQEEKSMMSDPAFNRRFSKIIVDELTKDQTFTILQNLRGSFVQHHNNRISINDEVLEIVVQMADQYKKAGSHRPDNAITLLDRACADAIIRRKYDEYNLRNSPAALQALKAQPQIPISAAQVRQTAIRLATGNSKPEKLDVNKLKTALSRIKGQDNILETLTSELSKHELNLIPSVQPLTMLFIGPSGVGKSEVTKIIAEELTGCPPIILNMTEYNSAAEINRIIGSPAGFIGSDSDAELPFDILESNPYQIILLDEFEKCHDSVKKLFMSVFDEGALKTNRGNTIDFSRSIIIATTNAGYEIPKNSIGFSDGSVPEAKTNIKELSRYFDVALLNRFKKQITFNPISRDIYKEIIVSTYERLRDEIRSNHQQYSLPDAIPDNTLNNIIKSTYCPEFGARPANKAVEDFIYGEVMSAASPI